MSLLDNENILLDHTDLSHIYDTFTIEPKIKGDWIYFEWSSPYFKFVLPNNIDTISIQWHYPGQYHDPNIFYK